MDTPNASLRDLITSRARAKAKRDEMQERLFEEREVHKLTMEAKLTGVATGKQMENFIKCGHEDWWRTCKDCFDVEHFYYACNRKWCPRCNWKLTQQRAEVLRHWAMTIEQPKHVVLTMRNFDVLTRKKIRQFQKALLALRRSKFFKAVSGGCCSIEITNEGKGWHLHAHLLVNVRWLDAGQLAIKWGAVIGQEFGIVKVKDVRGQEFVQEVSKYVAKGSELASWPGETLWEFINAIKGVRFYAAFGELAKQAKSIKAFLATIRPTCECPKCQGVKFTFENERLEMLRVARAKERGR